MLGVIQRYEDEDKAAAAKKTKEVNVLCVSSLLFTVSIFVARLHNNNK